ncbi:hypothetical protein [Metabacillus malikii]|uniref:DNA-binding phage protein n=1 Tax=Metabacillus malikii TaxID=1504265 RepID=A0ABT9ZFS2_9BACI|nr:hypothetical protein [Metabacillus malikii]MDQ0231132.1 DNA-binding phage protein [Metabacillus malikii]
MTNKLFRAIDVSRFRADEEDVQAYVKSTINRMDKQEMLSWLNQLSSQELSDCVTAYLTDKLSVELGEKELF